MLPCTYNIYPHLTKFPPPLPVLLIHLRINFQRLKLQTQRGDTYREYKMSRQQQNQMRSLKMIGTCGWNSCRWSLSYSVAMPTTNVFMETNSIHLLWLPHNIYPNILDLIWDLVGSNFRNHLSLHYMLFPLYTTDRWDTYFSPAMKWLLRDSLSFYKITSQTLEASHESLARQMEITNQ